MESYKIPIFVGINLLGAIILLSGILAKKPSFVGLGIGWLVLLNYFFANLDRRLPWWGRHRG